MVINDDSVDDAGIHDDDDGNFAAPQACDDEDENGDGDDGDDDAAGSGDGRRRR